MAANYADAHVRITIESAAQPVAQAQGSIILHFSNKSASGRLDLLPGGAITVIRNGNTLTESHPFQKAGQSPQQWTRMNLLEVARTTPALLPDVQVPGVDPFQLITLLNGVRWQSDLVGEWPMVVAQSAGQHVEYQITLSTSRLSQLALAPDRAWLKVMSGEKDGGKVTLEVTLDRGRISSIASDLPMPSAPAIPASGKPKVGATAAPGTAQGQAMHAMVLMQFEYAPGRVGTGR